jgi:nucleotide-binding universal stress UspA family protein
MYERLLLAYDGTREGRTALREGALLAHRDGARLFLLCVVDEVATMRIAEPTYGGLMAGARDPEAEVFEEAMDRLKALGFEPEGKLVTGEPVAQIAAYAKGFKADLVVVGHRKKGLLQRWWSGKTGASLMDQLDCSLLIARRVISDEAFRAEMGLTSAQR